MSDFIRTANKRKRKINSTTIFYIVLFIGLAIYAITILYPIFWLLINSFKPMLQYTLDMSIGNAFALPEKIKWENYSYAWNNLTYKDNSIFEMIINSVYYCVVSVGVNVFLSACAGYVISKYDFKARNLIYTLALVFLTLPIFGTGGASFSLYYNLGLYDTLLYPIVSSLGSFGMRFLMFYSYFKSISWEYAEAVFIDGGSDFTVFFKIMIPIAKPIFLTLGIMGLIGAWNTYEAILIYMPSYPTLAVGLYGLSLKFDRTGNMPAYYAILILSVIPIIAIFAGFSNTIMENFSIGGIKG